MFTIPYIVSYFVELNVYFCSIIMIMTMSFLFLYFTDVCVFGLMLFLELPAKQEVINDDVGRLPW
mgnify:CR=1 FL=1